MICQVCNLDLPDALFFKVEGGSSFEHLGFDKGQVCAACQVKGKVCSTDPTLCRYEGALLPHTFFPNRFLGKGKTRPAGYCHGCWSLTVNNYRKRKGGRVGYEVKQQVVPVGAAGPHRGRRKLR